MYRSVLANESVPLRLIIVTEVSARSVHSHFYFIILIFFFPAFDPPIQWGIPPREIWKMVFRPQRLRDCVAIAYIIYCVIWISMRFATLQIIQQMYICGGIVGGLPSAETISCTVAPGGGHSGIVCAPSTHKPVIESNRTHATARCYCLGGIDVTTTLQQRDHPAWDHPPCWRTRHDDKHRNAYINVVKRAKVRTSGANSNRDHPRWRHGQSRSSVKRREAGAFCRLPWRCLGC